MAYLENMLAAWVSKTKLLRSLLLSLISALLLVQSASFGFHQGFHGGATVGASIAQSHESACLTSRPETLASAYEWLGEICGLCQLQRALSASELVVPALCFVPRVERFEAPLATRPPTELGSAPFSARAPPV